MIIRPGPDLIAVVFALMKLGAVPVLIDPGLARSDMLDCIEDAMGEFGGKPVGISAIRRVMGE